MTSLVTTRRKGGVLVWSRVIETITCSEHFGGTGKKRFTCGKQKAPNTYLGVFVFTRHVSTVVTGVFKVVVSAGYLEKNVFNHF